MNLNFAATSGSRLSKIAHVSFIALQLICYCNSRSDEKVLLLDLLLQLMEAIQLAARKEKPPIANLFTDVYEENPPNLVEQERSLGETIKKHPQDYPSDVPL